MKNIDSQASIVNNSQVQQKPKKKHKALKTVAVIGTAALIGGAIYLKKNDPTKLENIANAINDNVITPLKQKDVPVKEKVQTIVNNVLSTFSGSSKVEQTVSQGAEQVLDIVDTFQAPAVQTPKFDLKEMADKVMNGIKNNAFFVGSFAGTAATGTILSIANSEEAENKAEVEDDVKALPPAETAEEEAVEEIKEEVTEEVAEEAAEEITEEATEETTDELPVEETVEDEIPAEEEAVKESEATEETIAEEIKTEETPAEEAVVEETAEEAVKEAPQLNYEVKTPNGEILDKPIRLSGMTGSDGEPLQGSLNIEFKDGKRVTLAYKDGSLAQSMIFDESGQIVPTTIKNYTNGKANVIYNGLRTQKGKKGFIADETSSLNGNFLAKKVIVKGGKTIEEHYKKNLDEDGNIQGKPIHVFSVKPELLSDGTKRRSFSIPTEDGERLIRTSENKDGHKTITLMSVQQEPLAALVTEPGEQFPSKYLVHVDGGKLDGSISLTDGKFKDMENLTFGAIEVDPETGESIVTFNADNADEVHLKYIKITADEDENIKKIAAYSSADSETPDCETTFEDGIPVKDFFYDEAGNVVFSSKYASKK